MSKTYSDKEILILREGGGRLAWIMQELGKFLKKDLIVDEIEKKALYLIKKVDAKPATVNYTPFGAFYPFPSAVCTSINDGVAHGISVNNKYKLKEGDIISLDIVIQYKGLYVDICRTYGIGKLKKQDLKLIKVAREVTNKAISQVRIGKNTENVGKIAEKTARKYNFDTVKILGGHAVGRKIHDKPFIPNAPNLGIPVIEFKKNMVLAIEPIVVAGKPEIKLDKNKYLYLTKDGKNSAQFEETILLTKNGPEILTTISEKSFY